MNTLTRIRNLIRKLRDPESGCVWNQAQNFQSIVPFTIEEAYEVSDAVHDEAWSHLVEELGDLLYQVLYLCELGEEEGWFTFDSVTNALERKILRRNPAIFDEDGSSEKKTNTSLGWSRIKSADRKNEGMTSELDNIPNTLPSVLVAKKIQERVASAGFESHTVDRSRRKMKKALITVKSQCIRDSSECSGSDELGDLMFALVNIGLDAHIDLDDALRKTNKNFERRFRRVEKELESLGETFQEVSTAKLEELWNDTIF
jgi:MazG family protein